MLRVINPRTHRVAIVCACLGVLLGLGIWASAHKVSHLSSIQEFEPTIVNKTKALEIVNTTKVLIGEVYVLRVTLKNVSSKNITSYTYLTGHAVITNGYAFSQRLLGPGETADEHIPYENLQTAATTFSEREADLVFTAVWFEGGTGDGDPKFIRQLSDESEGIKEQAGLILPLLRKALRDPEIQEDEVLTALESQISHLPTEDGSASQSIDYKLGRSMANRQLAFKVKELRENKNKSPGINRKTEVTGSLASWERLLTRF
ncbi:MAG TPA: hypothetical protein VKC61_14890 [Pyrinomonadaceae bacterium]|nr:hypothetical protein [Pyrinomonadaceae bacterium]